MSDPAVRLAQYVLLGVGGLRMLGALGIDPANVHLNEGHAAFATLERVDDADHSFHVRARSGRNDAQARDAMLDVAAQWMLSRA